MPDPHPASARPGAATASRATPWPACRASRVAATPGAPRRRGSRARRRFPQETASSGPPEPRRARGDQALREVETELRGRDRGPLAVAHRNDDVRVGDARAAAVPGEQKEAALVLEQRRVIALGG